MKIVSPMIRAVATFFCAVGAGCFDADCKAQPPSQTHAQADRHDTFSRSDLEKLITSHKISTIAELVEKLPDDFKLFRTEMYDSKSLHCASPESPRVIMLSAKAHLACSYNSGVAADYASNPRNCADTLNKLECMQYDPATKKDTTFEISFNPDGTKDAFDLKSRTQNNPESCTSCHTKDTRRIWHPYHIWPCAYGSNDDARLGGFRADGQNPKEREFELEYLKNKNPRYSQLPKVQTPSKFQSALRQVLKEDQEEKEEEEPYWLASLGFHRRPNLAINVEFQKMQIEKIAHDVGTDPKLKPARYAILGTLLCGIWNLSFGENGRVNLKRREEDFFPNHVALDSMRVLAKASRQMKSFSDLTMAERKACLGADLAPQERGLEGGAAGANSTKISFEAVNDEIRIDFKNHFFRTAFLETADLIYLKEAVGVDFSRWSMNFDFSMIFADGVSNFTHDAGIAIAEELIRRGDQELKSIYVKGGNKCSVKFVKELSRLSRKALEEPKSQGPVRVDVGR